MVTDTTLNFTSYITLIVSIITAFAAIIAPVLTAIINQRGNRKLKSLELFFDAQSNAYLKFLDASSKIPIQPSDDDIIKLNTALTDTLLFSTKDTQSKISLYAAYLVEGNANPVLVAEAYKSALLAMQNELKKYR